MADRDGKLPAEPRPVIVERKLPGYPPASLALEKVGWDFSQE
jgi:hypothetical protein